MFMSATVSNARFKRAHKSKQENALEFWLFKNIFGVPYKYIVINLK